MAHERVELALAAALADAERRGLRGQAVTPFLLRAIGEATGGESVEANLALLENDARVGAEIAVALSILRDHILRTVGGVFERLAEIRLKLWKKRHIA